MKYAILFLLFLSHIQIGSAQTYYEVEEALKTIKEKNQISQLKLNHPQWYIQSKTITRSDSIKNPEVIDAQIGDTFRQNYNKTPRILTKVLDLTEIELCKLKYIYLDGQKKSAHEIDAIRSHILKEFKQGVPFETLRQQYNMDSNKTGYLGWFKKGEMVKEFEKVVWNKEKGSIFTVNVPSHKWYYVVYKTHTNKKECALECISIDFDYTNPTN